MREVKWIEVRERTNEKRADEDTKIKGYVQVREKNRKRGSGEKKETGKSRNWRAKCKGEETRNKEEKLQSCSVSSCYQTRASKRKESKAEERGEE